jgi:hypothetical protein
MTSFGCGVGQFQDECPTLVIVVEPAVSDEHLAGPRVPG